MNHNAETAAIQPINYRIDDFCKAYGISRVSLYEYWKRGDGPEYFMVGKRRLIPAEAAKNWRPKQAARGEAA